MQETNKDRIVIATDLADREGIGVEVYRNNELLVEIFRNDKDKSRTVTLYKKDISLDVVEDSITAFKDKVSWEFAD